MRFARCEIRSKCIDTVPVANEVLFSGMAQDWNPASNEEVIEVFGFPIRCYHAKTIILLRRVIVSSLLVVGCFHPLSMMTKEISCPRLVEGEQLMSFCNLSFAIFYVIVEVQDGGKLRSRDCVLLSRSSSKLASLFGQDKASFLGGNESLTYTAPKQPKKEKPGDRLLK